MKNVLLFLPQGFEELEAAAFTDVLGWSRTDGKIPVGVKTGGLRKRIQCTWNMIVEPELLIDSINVDDFDALAIPGGFEEADFYEDAYDERFLSLIREFDAKEKYIASICVAALPVAKSGVLQDRKGTTYNLDEGKRKGQLAEFGVNVQDQLIVIDNNIITSSCPATALPVAFKLLELLTTPENLHIVKEKMGFNEPLLT